MRRNICLVLIVLIFFVVSGCSCKKDDGKTSLQIGDYNVDTYQIIDFDVLSSMIESKENFLLYVYQDDCQGCMRFKPILENVIKDRHIYVYGIRYQDIKKGHELKKIEATPAIAVYQEGKLRIKVDALNNEEYFVDNGSLMNFLDKYTYMPTAYYVNLEQLNEKINRGDSFIVYYSRSSCSDCFYLNRNYLKEYLNNNVNSKYFYILETEVEGIRYSDGEYDAEQWQKFKDDFGLSEANNPLGHGVGYVPTFQYYENGAIREMMVYFNDGEYITNEDGSTYVIINNSYYSDNPYINKTLSYSDYKNKLEGYYNEKLRVFLDSNLEKVN